MKKDLLRKVGLIVASLLIAGKMSAAEPPAKPWHWDLGSGLEVFKGNTDKVALDGSSDLEWITKQNELLFKLNGVYGETKRIKDANKGDGTLNYDRNFFEKEGLFVFTTPAYDEFQKLDLRWQNGAGLKHSFIKNERYNSSLSVGALYEIEQYSTSNGVDKHDVTRMSFRPKFKAMLNEKNSFTFIGFYQPRVDRWEKDYRLTLDAALEINIFEKLYFEVRVTDEYNEVVPEGTKRNDVGVINSIKLKL